MKIAPACLLLLLNSSPALWGGGEKNLTLFSKCAQSSGSQMGMLRMHDIVEDDPQECALCTSFFDTSAHVSQTRCDGDSHIRSLMCLITYKKGVVLMFDFYIKGSY